ncbi:MAG: hypothetical protein JXB06_11515 [Spirochaetales bacterium]|nr:hypothetical protein [Spirochaetales bacterium]
MNVKRIVVMLVIAGVAAGGVFASGNKEQQPEPTRPDWRRVPPGDAPELSEETIRVTGQLYFENRMHPELESGGMEYELLVPRFYAYDLDLEEGQTVTIEGYTVEGMPCCEGEDEEEVHIWVTKAVIDGQEYDLQAEGFRGGFMGPHGGMGMMRPGRRPYGYGDRDPRDWGRRW